MSHTFIGSRSKTLFEYEHNLSGRITIINQTKVIEKAGRIELDPVDLLEFVAQLIKNERVTNLQTHARVLREADRLLEAVERLRAARDDLQTHVAKAAKELDAGYSVRHLAEPFRG